MRRLAALTLVRRGAAAAIAAVAVCILIGAAGATSRVAAADPTTVPAPGGSLAPPSCSERYPAEGPAGLDLRLGCIIGELVGHYTGTASADATPASTYGLVVLGVLVAAVVVIWLVGRLVGRAAGRRLAPVRPDEWWLCSSCRSVNGAGVARCYSCGASRPDGPTLRTDDAPSTTQSFGSTRKRG